jgi:hypothetical protein
MFSPLKTNYTHCNESCCKFQAIVVAGLGIILSHSCISVVSAVHLKYNNLHGVKDEAGSQAT